ncbi:hypothetical protein CPC08DRAFT_763419 [Agrocybe pediades]|nr:hypothetical protein CPC08DRAFT_763419 [Agrocybe pediades]
MDTDLSESPYDFDAHPFALSPKSRRLQRDFFIFEFDPEDIPGLMIAGLNQRITKASLFQVKRWLEILFPLTKRPDYDLAPITLNRVGLFSYEKERTENTSILTDPNQVIQAGYYGLIANGFRSRVTHFRQGTYPKDTYAQREQRMKDLPDEYEADTIMRATKQNELYDEDINMRECIPDRDEQFCLITGMPLNPDDVGVSWIVPPGFINQEEYAPLFQYRCDTASSRIPANCITMHKALVKPFFRNSFGIDVADGFRIVVFEDLGEASALLSSSNMRATKLEEAINRGDKESPNVDFVNGHFRHCLRSIFLGGEITQEEEYNASECRAIVEQAEAVKWNPSDPFWQTFEGREAKAVMNRRRVTD